uniref:Uncharacterized protein n=1 Tax=Anguilla anguilla TaxID=7936 RepID=A0A0E9WFF9_ANGAN
MRTMIFVNALVHHVKRVKHNALNCQRKRTITAFTAGAFKSFTLPYFKWRNRVNQTVEIVFFFCRVWVAFPFQMAILCNRRIE